MGWFKGISFLKQESKLKICAVKSSNISVVYAKLVEKPGDISKLPPQRLRRGDYCGRYIYR